MPGRASSGSFLMRRGADAEWAAAPVLETDVRRDGERRAYVVSGARVVDHGQGEVMGETWDDRLTLVTCWPFDAIRPGGPLRYVVTALLDDGSTPSPQAVGRAQRRSSAASAARPSRRRSISAAPVRGFITVTRRTRRPPSTVVVIQPSPERLYASRRRRFSSSSRSASRRPSPR